MNMTGGRARRPVVTYPFKVRVINRVREWETQFWLLVMSAVVLAYMALTGLKARITGGKPDRAGQPRGTENDR